MKTVGVIGGMSWESSLEYYRLLNEGVKARLGGLHSAQVLLYSLDFQPIEEMQNSGDWESMGDILVDAASRLEKGGADLVLLATNTMHKLAPRIEGEIGIPLLHIADVAASAAVSGGVSRVGLLGTKFTMEQDFYRERLATHGIEAIIPEPNDRDIIHRVIYRELCLGRVKAESKREFLRVIRGLAERGAGAVVLGCTEIPLLIHQEDVEILVIDTTRLHVEAAIELALG